jgi:hypothetical protein
MPDAGVSAAAITWLSGESGVFLRNALIHLALEHREISAQAFELGGGFGAARLGLGDDVRLLSPFGRAAASFTDGELARLVICVPLVGRRAIEKKV